MALIEVCCLIVELMIGEQDGSRNTGVPYARWDEMPCADPLYTVPFPGDGVWFEDQIAIYLITEFAWQSENMADGKSAGVGVGHVLCEAIVEMVASHAFAQASKRNEEAAQYKRKRILIADT